jgi:hypothetical protein
VLSSAYLAGVLFFALVSALHDIPQAFRDYRDRRLLTLASLAGYVALIAAVCVLWPVVAVGVAGLLGWKRFTGEI